MEELDEDEEEVDPPMPGPPDIPSGPLGVSIKSRQRGELLLRPVGACEAGSGGEGRRGERVMTGVVAEDSSRAVYKTFDIMFFFVCVWQRWHECARENKLACMRKDILFLSCRAITVLCITT